MNCDKALENSRLWGIGAISCVYSGMWEIVDCVEIQEIAELSSILGGNLWLWSNLWVAEETDIVGKIKNFKKFLTVGNHGVFNFLILCFQIFCRLCIVQG